MLWATKSWVLLCLLGVRYNFLGSVVFPFFNQLLGERSWGMLTISHHGLGVSGSLMLPMSPIRVTYRYVRELYYFGFTLLFEFDPSSLGSVRFPRNTN